MLPIFLAFATLFLTDGSRMDRSDDSDERKPNLSSRYAALTKRYNSGALNVSEAKTYNTLIRPTNQNVQLTMEVLFNNVPRSLLLDTGSADTWMISPDFECLDVNGSAVALPTCKLGDAYTGPAIPQIGNETLYQVYGSGESLTGTFGFADVTVAGLELKRQKVALAQSGYIIGDNVRSGVVGLAQRSVTRLFENTVAMNSPPNGSVTPYSPIVESVFKDTSSDHGPLSLKFSLALERGDAGGYIAFGGLPPVNVNHDFVATPLQGINYLGREDPERYYPIQPDGLNLDGVLETTKYRAIIDSGTGANRLPQDIADRVNAAYDPPAIYDPQNQIYITSCNATAPHFSFVIGNTSFAMHPKDMFLPASAGDLCATTFTRGLETSMKAYPDGFYIIGTAFLFNVIAVFDVGAKQMLFAQHEY